VTANCGQIEVALQVYERGTQAGCFHNYQLVGDTTPLQGLKGPNANNRDPKGAVGGGQIHLEGTVGGQIHIIDLHGTSEIGCRVCLLSWLRYLRTHKDVLAAADVSVMRVITGWGKHSESGVSKVSRVGGGGASLCSLNAP
jgi:hypothetical protein